MRDNFGRYIDYMRISVTDRCNLRCIYCMPSEGIRAIKHREILRYEEIVRIVRLAAGLGVKKVRITGGEPLARKNITYLIAQLKNIEGMEELTLTTNGVLLERYAKEIAEAGLNRVNISLDSLRPDRYREITRGGDIDTVHRGIRSAEKVGLIPVKINMVPIRGFNDDEIEEFAKITMTMPCHVRFIEFMPIGAKEIWSNEKYIPTDEIKSIVQKIAPLTPVRVRRSGPARYFRLNGASGVIGFISAITHHFCGDCNRLRLTADGKIRPCLFSDTEIDLKAPIRSGASDTEIERLLRLAIAAKPRGHNIHERSDLDLLKPMSKIGG